MSIIKDQHGATMVEFALSIGFFLFLLGGIVDLGLSMHRKSMLMHASKQIARLLSMQLASSPDCSVNDVRNTINNQLQNLNAQGMGIPVSTWNFTWHVPSGTALTDPSFNLSLTSQVPCFFLCHLSPTGWAASASIEETVGRQGLICSSPITM